MDTEQTEQSVTELHHHLASLAPPDKVQAVHTLLPACKHPDCAMVMLHTLAHHAPDDYRNSRCLTYLADVALESYERCRSAMLFAPDVFATLSDHGAALHRCDRMAVRTCKHLAKTRWTPDVVLVLLQLLLDFELTETRIFQATGYIQVFDLAVKHACLEVRAVAFAVCAHAAARSVTMATKCALAFWTHVHVADLAMPVESAPLVNLLLALGDVPPEVEPLLRRTDDTSWPELAYWRRRTTPSASFA